MIVRIQSFHKIIFALALILLAAVPASAASHYRGMNVHAGMDLQDLIDLAALGVNHARYQLSYDESVDSMSIQDYLTSLEARLDHLDELLPTFAAFGIKITLDMHSPPCGFTSRAAPFPKMAIFSSATCQTALLDAWSIIANHYVGSPYSDQILAYEFVSEVAIGDTVTAGIMTWPQLAKAIAQLIRETGDTRLLIMNPPYSNPDRLTKKMLLKGVGKVYYGINVYYYPDFVNQGIGSAPTDVIYPNGNKNKGGMQKFLKKALAFSKKYKAKLVVGEMSVSRFAPDTSARNYLEDLITTFEKSKIYAWSFHIWREADPWDIELGSEPGNQTRMDNGRQTTLINYFSLN